MQTYLLSDEQKDAVLHSDGHAPCPGVDIQMEQALGAAPEGGPDIHATIYSPTNRPKEQNPVLLAFHGGGYQNGNPGDCGELAKHLALTFGITTVAPSYRLATATTSTFPGILHDAAHAYRWLIAHANELNVDPMRIIVSGGSAGVIPAGHLAVASPHIGFKLDEPRPVAFLALWGCMDFVARWFDNHESSGSEAALLGGGYETNPALYHQSSPVTYAQGKLPPALYIYGRQDRIVHRRQGYIGHTAWQATGAHSELRVFPNIGHQIEGDNREQRDQALKTITGFLAARVPQK